MKKLDSPRQALLPAPERPSAAAIWFGVLGGPAAFSLAFLVGLMLVRPRCEGIAPAARIGLVLGMLLVGGAAAAIAWRSWRSLRASVQAAEASPAGVSRFGAIAGVALSGLSLLLIAWMGIVLLVLDPCLT